MSDYIIQKFKDKFFEEANMLLDKFERDILELEKTPENHELLESVFRAMHTIKGISAMYGFEYISEFTHILENIFQNLRDGKTQFTREISEVSLLSIDHIHNLLSDEKLQNPELRTKHSDLLTQVNNFSSGARSSEQTKPESLKSETDKIQSWLIIINASEHLYFRGIKLRVICSELSALGRYVIEQIPVLNSADYDSWEIILVAKTSLQEIYDVLMFIEDECQVVRLADYDILNPGIALAEAEPDTLGGIREPSITELIEQSISMDAMKKETLPSGENSIDKQIVYKYQSKRILVETEKLDNLMYLVSQLITLNSQIIIANRESDSQRQTEYIETLDALSKQFRSNALELRLVPLSDITLRLQRLIRDLSKTMGKKIDFHTEGIDAELDKNTIDGLSEPLMHIIRNCVDHGIEDPKMRLQHGKPETGTIKLSASYSGSNIIIRVHDDGNGIDLEKVHKKAIAKGILRKEDKPTGQELLNMIFIPGFSTAQNLSEVSGRGVGMDIVKKGIADLRGSVTIESKSGSGTTFIIKLSQSMAITDTLLFKVEDSYFILPVSEIVSCDNVDTINLARRKYTSTIPYNEELIPFVDLRNHLQLEGSYSGNAKSIIVHSEDQTIAIIADKIIGEHQAVLKPLNRVYSSETIISSASQIGDGQIAFLIDTGTLKKQIC